MRRMGIAVAFLATLTGAGGTARAEWQQATTRHFVVYADDSPREVRDLAERLERFDGVLRWLLKVPDAAGQAANRVSVYVVPGGVDGLQKVCGKCRNVAGFYVPRAAGAVLFTPERIGSGSKLDTNPQIVLFHEYTHHLLLANSGAAYPAWFGEGLPEFASTTRFEKDAAIVGGAAYHRAYGLVQGPGIPVEALFAPAGRKLSAIEREAVYGQGWVLTHMTIMDPKYDGQRERYLKSINSGKPSLEAAREAFGDLKALDRAMRDYITKPLRAARLPATILPAAPEVSVRTLTPGEAAMAPLRMVSTRGVDRAQGAALYARAAPIAARYPADAVAQGWFAEIAYDAGHDAEAEAAADRALVVDPRSTQAMLYKAEVRLRAAVQAKATDPKVWGEARSWILKANKVNTDEAAPFVLFHRSFLMARQKPSPSAVQGLYRALELAPQDRGLRMTAARQALMDGKLDDARAALRTLAYDPHAAPDNPAAKLLLLLDSPEGAAAAALAAPTDDEGSAD